MIHTLEDFCRWLYGGADENRLRRRYFQLQRLSRNGVLRGHYRPITLAKRDGGIRVVYAPSQALKRVQRGIADLLADTPLLPCVTAYRKGGSLLQNGAPHAGKRLVVKLDLRDFFGSIRFVQVFSAIDRALGVSDKVGVHELNAYDRPGYDGRTYNRVLSFYFARFCTLDGRLAQGAPSSPLLSNLVFLPIDQRIMKWCEKRNIAYTRYSDDLTFSGEFNPHTLLRFMEHLLEQNGFCLHQEKTAVVGSEYRQKVTGLVVNRRPRPDADYRRQIRQEVYFLTKYGTADHLSRLQKPCAPDDQRRYLRGLLGRIQFVLQYDGENQTFLEYRGRIRALLREILKILQ